MKQVQERILFDLRNNKLSHAILIDGGTQEGRAELARTIAKALVCSGRNAPCEVCFDCIKASANSHPDILFYAGGTTVGSFKVDMVREIRQTASILPNEAERKVFVLENVESMAATAQNALLKILEEPPAYVTFILTCPSHSAMLQTILSRVTVYSCPEIQNTVDSEDEKKAETIVINILENVASNKEWDVLKICSAFEKDKELFKLCCKKMQQLCEQALVNRITDNDGDMVLEQIGNLFPKSTLITLIDICGNTLDSIQKNLNGNLLMNLFCAQLFAD